MTLYILFEEIENGSLTLETELNVSEKASRGGSKNVFRAWGNCNGA